MNKRFFRILTSSVRTLPDFLIVGAQKCGTTSLYNYLTEHPCVMPAVMKEVHFFDVNFNKSTIWYRSFFPTVVIKNYFKRIYKRNLITGESSPYYLFHPHVPKRIFSILPNVKIVMLLRNPVDRAYSHYNQEVKLRFEYLSFKEAIELEQERLNGEVEKILEDENYYSYNHGHYSYLARGIYVDQIKNWLRFFSKKQVLILRSEDFFRNPAKITKKIFKFLEIPNWSDIKYKKFAEGSYKKMDNEIRENLIRYFKLHNQRLYKFLGKDFKWDN